MKPSIGFSLATLALASSSLMAHAESGVRTFVCKVEKNLQGKEVTISFKLKGVGTDTPDFSGKFKISPKLDALRALNTGDNNSISKVAKGVEIYCDEIGMYSTTLFLYSDRDYRFGYVKTGGESNENLYSPISCTVN